MKCSVGVHTGRIALQFIEHDWANIKMLVDGGKPPRVGRRSWFIMQLGGGITAERSSVGVAPHTHNSLPGHVIISNDTNTIVRCAVHEREVTFPRLGQMRIEMPPYHLWPWIKDSRYRHKAMTPEKWRWHLVQELNERIRSATAHHTDMPEIPDWARKMLTGDEWRRVRHNEEI